MSDVDHYAVLNVPRSATAAEIKAAYRQLVALVHPDRGGDPSEFRLVREAYEVLGDPARRTLYDDRTAPPEYPEPPDPEPEPRPVYADPPPRPDPQPAYADPPPYPEYKRPFPQKSTAPPASGPRTHKPRTSAYRPRTPSEWLLIAVSAGVLSALGFVIVRTLVQLATEPFGTHVLNLIAVPPALFVIVSAFGREAPDWIRKATYAFVGLMCFALVMIWNKGDYLEAVLGGLVALGILVVPALGRRCHAARDWRGSGWNSGWSR